MRVAIVNYSQEQLGTMIENIAGDDAIMAWIDEVNDRQPVFSKEDNDVAFFRRWVFISPLVFEIVMNFICYGALSTTGLSIRVWICFKYNEGNALNV